MSKPPAREGYLILTQWGPLGFHPTKDKAEEQAQLTKTTCYIVAAKQFKTVDPKDSTDAWPALPDPKG